ncbi:MAG: PAS domain-containing protein [Cyanobacteria bacterium P01_H01_bin.105]
MPAMSDCEPLPHAIDDADALALKHRLSELEQERHDLQLMLEMAIEHSDTLLDTLRQQNNELALRLDADSSNFENNNLGDAHSSIDQFQQVAEAIPVGLMIAHLVDGQIVYGNPAVCRLLGVSVEQLEKQKITDFCCDSLASQELVSVMLNQQRFRGELCWSTPSGSIFDAAVSLQPFVFNGEPTMLTVIQTALPENP